MRAVRSEDYLLLNCDVKISDGSVIFIKDTCCE